MKHTPTPWFISTKYPQIIVAKTGEYSVTGAHEFDFFGGYLVAESMSEENVRYILHCVNMHDQLVCTLRKMIYSLRMHEGIDLEGQLVCLLREARAVLQKEEEASKE